MRIVNADPDRLDVDGVKRHSPSVVQAPNGRWHLAGDDETLCGEPCGDWRRVLHWGERGAMWCGVCLRAFMPP